MKRSFINRKITDAIAFLNANKFYLPVWAYWTPEQWAAAGHDADEIRQRKLGWDVTDFGSGDFARRGLLLFTIRNGEFRRDPDAKDYCEKLLLVDEEQETPVHFHWAKMEDIINRGGGVLVLQLWNGDPKTEEILQTPVTVSIDGVATTIPGGGYVKLNPGQSVTLPRFNYHRFFAEKSTGMVLGGEVSRVNDDENDNRFNPTLPRFSQIEEDAPKAFYLCNEYPAAK
ncbi:MAG: D-lyxose/D-mannose family sugar isomerase [Phycisphaerae bacterium]|nr:D-lyxose/D-mannose family sugar isomerase [Phycisphaerae bacterium]